MAQEIGADINLAGITGAGNGSLGSDAVLFSESHGRVILATPDPDAVIRELRDVPHRVIGKAGGDELKIGLGGGDGADVVLSLHEIREAGEGITRMMR
jgi:phosphoribosylformylglycinamidine (FGAM) synthase-like enzyme